MLDHTDTYTSLYDLASKVRGYFDAIYCGFSTEFNKVSGPDEVIQLATRGWEEAGPKAMALAEEAVQAAERQVESFGFTSVWDVSGSQVDVATYLAGEPECMVDYLSTPSPRSGRVVTLCASTSASGVFTTAQIEKRGHAVVALALALTRLGLGVEIWADSSAEGSYGVVGRVRTLIKGANDELDTAKIMFALAHPAMERALAFAAVHAMPGKVQSALGESYGRPIDPKEDLPEGTVYLPCLLYGTAIPEPLDMVLSALRKLGIISEDA